MNYDDTRQYLLSRPEAWEDFPFGPGIAVMKIGKKMFATLSRNGDEVHSNLKCDPDEAVMLRDIFAGVLPGYHMNKRHWNTVIVDADVPDCEIERMIDRSYGLVVKSLGKIEREALILRYGKDTLFK